MGWHKLRKKKKNPKQQTNKPDSEKIEKTEVSMGTY